MTLDISGVQLASTLAGLENYENEPFFFSVDGHTLAAGAVSKWTTSWQINNTDAISGTQIMYTLDNIRRFMSGAIVNFYNSRQYEVETLTYYLGSEYHVETYVINNTGSTITIPQFYVNVEVSLFNAPF